MTVHPLRSNVATETETRLSAFPEVVLTDVGLRIAADLSFDRWTALGETLRFFHRAASWLIGEWAVYGEQHFGDDYLQAISERTGYEPESVRAAQWVAERIPVERRNPDLSYAHHRAVAALEPAEQSRWLTEAASEGLTTRELYERSHPPKTPLEAPPSPQQAAEAVSDALRPVLGMFVEPEHLEALVDRVMRVLRSQGVLG